MARNDFPQVSKYKCVKIICENNCVEIAWEYTKHAQIMVEIKILKNIQLAKISAVNWVSGAGLVRDRETDWPLAMRESETDSVRQKQGSHD